jgi:hypothetical protein
MEKASGCRTIYSYLVDFMLADLVDEVVDIAQNS